uniref:Uncharacterized protein n=1 Tax=Plectus sambesii TaxID=2011161 RepID=A0A914ULP9_9BILA
MDEYVGRHQARHHARPACLPLPTLQHALDSLFARMSDAKFMVRQFRFQCAISRRQKCDRWRARCDAAALLSRRVWSCRGMIDLSHNRLVEFPTSLCEYGYLESLRLAHNCLRSLPVTVQLLESLTYLDLSRNHLTTLPPALCVLPLEVLLLANNRLEYIPREIRQLADTLTELDISCNRLTYVPPDLGMLKCLRVLNMRENLLIDLPSEVCRLRLRILNVSSNKIGQLPLDLRLMSSLVELAIDANPLTAPPAKLCVKGRVHAFKWLDVDAAHKGRKQLEWPSQRPISIGGGTLGRAAKTTAADDYKYVLDKKAERRARSSRFNTIGGDSGYSTVDEQNRLSQDISNALAHQNGAPTSTTAAPVKLRRTSPVGEEAPPHTTDYNSLAKNGAANMGANMITVTSYDQPRPVQILPSPGSPPPNRHTRSTFDNGDQPIANGLVEEVMNACSKHERMNGLQTPQRVRLASPEMDGSPTPRAPSCERESAPVLIASSNPRPTNRMLDLSTVTTTTKRTMRSDEIQSIYTGGKSKGQPDGAGLSPVIESPMHGAAPFSPTSFSPTSFTSAPLTRNNNNNNIKPKTPPPPPPAQAAPIAMSVKIDAEDLDLIMQKWPNALDDLSSVVWRLSDLFDTQQDINNNRKPGDTERMVAALGVALFILAVLYAILSQLCSGADVQDKKNLPAVAKTVAALAKQLGGSPAVRKESVCSTAATVRKQPTLPPPRAAPKISSV